MDPSQHPKYNPHLGRIERRGRPKKATPPPEDEATKSAREKNAPKVKECMDVIMKQFGNMANFLKAWDNEPSTGRNKFLKKGGAAEMISRWLPHVQGLQGSDIQETVIQMCNEEIKGVMASQICPLRYVQKDKGAESRVALHGNITSNLDEMQVFLSHHAPLSWSILSAIAAGPVERKNAVFSTLGAFAGLLNCRNQKINAYQTIILVYLYSSGLNKSALEVLHRLNLCSSYGHLNDVLKRLAGMLQAQLREDVLETPMRLTIDNVNLFTGVRDGSSIRQGRMNNSTGGYITPVVGGGSSGRVLPRSWLNLGARVNLDPRELKASAEALSYLKSWNKWYMCKLLKDHIRGLAVGETECLKPVIKQLDAEVSSIYTTELFDIPQDSIVGNHTSIRKVLTETMKYSLQELMDGLFLVGGDQLLADRIRSLQKMMEGDVPGEDFSYVVALLGPLHTLMNVKKLIMRHHIGPTDGSVPGSLMSFNKSLKRDRKIDSEAKDLWACMDLTRDSVDGVLLAMVVEEGGKNDKTWDAFAQNVRDGEVDWRRIVEQIANKLTYGYVSSLRKDKDDKDRDRVLENILLFVRQELEFRAFYTSMRSGDVGAMELILQVWGPQCLAGNQVKYGHEMLDIRCGMLADWSPELRDVIRSNWVVNPWGKNSKFLGLDELMEEIVRAMKDQYNPGSTDSQDAFLRKTISRCIIFFMAIKDDIRRGMGLSRKSGNHVKTDKKPEVQTLLRALLKEELLKEKLGRGKPTLEDPEGIKECPDLYSLGVAKIVDGKFWRSFLLRSPGCSQRMESMRILGSVDADNDEDEEGDDNDQGDAE